MKSVTPNLPPHIDLVAFQRIAALRSNDPKAFVRLNRFGPVAGPPIYTMFGDREQNACLIQRNSPVLMVAHVDTVCAPSLAARMVQGRLYHNAVDNRLGVYLGLELFPTMGLNVDLLLTTGEEQGSSTAGLFKSRKRYRWMFSFDRKGEDVVCYQYGCRRLFEILAGSGFAVCKGTYSCIAELEHLGCLGMNFGCGMADYHSDEAFCDLTMLDRQLRRFSAFYRQYSRLQFPYPEWHGVAELEVAKCDLKF